MSFIKTHAIIAITILFISSLSIAKTPQGKFVLVNESKLSKSRELYGSGEYKKNPVLKKLLKDCEKALGADIVTIMDKKDAGPSGSKHDYYSLANYYWPNPNTPDGLPYIKKDGEVNPDIYDSGDKESLPKMLKTTLNLGVGYYITGKPEYAEKGIKWLQTWFSDTLTMMNPNLDYSQVIRGSKKNNYSGIIDACEIPKVLDAIALLSGSDLMTEDMDKSLKKWFNAYLDWLLNSENGKKESKSDNNHGSWYDQDVAAVAYYVGKEDIAKRICENIRNKRISEQIEPDGSQPKELARTRSLHYSCYNLEALSRLARIGERVKVDIWGYVSSDGRSIKKALDYLIPFIAGDKKWENKQITDFKVRSFYEVFVMASDVYHDNTYCNAAIKNLGSENANMTDTILY
jgi:hypothetical protein